MKIKNKGKIYPSPSSSSAAAASLPALCNRDVLSVMKLLPAAILALASVLSLEDREVLAYMITRSLNSSDLSSSNLNLDSSKGSKRSSKKQPSGGGGSHKPPVFGCDCFDCYTSYWLRWDSSLDRELIHQVIEAFEEHLSTDEASTKRAGRGKRREKLGRRVASQPEPTAQLEDPAGPDPSGLPEAEAVAASTAAEAEPLAIVSTENEALPVTSPEADEAVSEAAEDTTGGDSSPEQAAAAGGSQHKGLARKVLPDVLGLLNSRLWSLWSPTV